MPRKFSTKILDTLLKTVEVEFKIPFIFGEIKFPVMNYAKEWWATEKARIDLLNAIESAEQKFKVEHSDEKIAQMWSEFPLYLDEDFQSVIAHLLKHLDENQIITIAENTIKRDWKNVATKEEIQRALALYLPYLRHELMGIKEFREIIDSLRLERIDEATQEIKSLLLGTQTSQPANVPVFIPETLTNPDELPPVSDFLPPGSRVPFYRNKIFTGRKADLLALAQSLVVHHTSSATAITQAAVATGMGGIGKTQLAVEFCYRYGYTFHGVHWIDARQSLETEIAACGREMDFPNFPKAIPDQVILTLRQWQKEPLRLLVLDNLEDPKILNEWLPKLNSLRILVTTRRRQWSADLGMDVRALNTLPRSESIVLLRRLARRLKDIPDDDLNTLGANLGDLPLALALAGTYLNKHDSVTTSGYLKRLEKEGLQALDELGVDPYDLPTRHDVAVSATLRAQWQSLGSVTAQRILQVIALVGEKVKITRSRLSHLIGSNNKFVVGYPNPIEEALRSLHDFSLIEDFSENRLSVHPLIVKFVETTIPHKETFLKLLFESGMKENPPLNIYMYWALTAKEQGDIENARRLFEYAAQLAFSDSPTYQAWAIMEKEQRDIERARELFALADKANPNNAPTYQAWAIMEKEQKDIKRARELFALADKANPNNAPTYQAWAIMEKEQGDIKGARKLFALAVAANPHDAPTYQAWAIMEKEQRDIERARELFALAVTADPNHVPTYQAWAIMEKEQKDIKRARELFDLAVTTDPNNAPTYRAWVIMEKEQKDIERARELFALAVKADPHDASTYQAWAIMEKEQKDIERARELFALAVKADSNHAPIYQAWAIMEKEQKDIERARELFTLAVKADPNNAPTYNAWVIMEWLENPSSALAIIDIALNNNISIKEKARLLGIQGRILASEGQATSAKKSFEDSLKLDNNNFLAHFYFAKDVLIPLNLYDDAVIHYQYALERKPKIEFREKIQKEGLVSHAVRVSRYLELEWEYSASMIVFEKQSACRSHSHVQQNNSN